MKKYFILAAVAATFAACSFDKDLSEGTNTTQMMEQSTPLNIGVLSNSAINGMPTRSNLTQTGNTTLLTNVGLYIYTNTNTAISSDYGFSNIKGTAGSATSVTYGSTSTTKDCVPLTPASTLSFPDIKTTAIDIYAYAPYSSSAPSNLTGTPTVSITTTYDQSSSYSNDDYLFGSITDGTNVTAANYLLARNGTAKDCFTTGGAVVVPMSHKLCKVNVNLMVSGMELNKLQNATVKIYPDYSQATMSLTDGTVTTDNSNGVNTSTGNVITLTTALGMSSGTEITAGQDGHPNNLGTGSTEGYSASGIIVPQTLSTSHKFVEITLSDGTTTYAYTPTALTLASGKVYTFNITVTASGLSVTTQVNNWEEDTWGTTSSPQNGDAELE